MSFSNGAVKRCVVPTATILSWKRLMWIQVRDTDGDNWLTFRKGDFLLVAKIDEKSGTRHAVWSLYKCNADGTRVASNGTWSQMRSEFGENEVKAGVAWADNQLSTSQFTDASPGSSPPASFGSSDAVDASIAR